MAKKVSLYRQVYHALRGRVLSGEYLAGEKIETEPELADQFDASLVTIRQAQQMLVEERLLDKRQGSGTYVPDDVARRQRVLCVCGLALTPELKARLGAYIGDFIILSNQEAAGRGMEFETAWLSPHEKARIAPYCEEPAIREYWGYVFVACGSDHALQRRVDSLKLRHVSLSPYVTTGNSVWIDFPEAIRLALDEFAGGEPPMLLGIDGQREWAETVVAEAGLDCQRAYLTKSSGDSSFETLGYQYVDHLLESGYDLSGLLLLDDTVARGATRALLKHRADVALPHVVVLAGEQQIVPLGLPITYVVHDVAEEVRQCFCVLDRQHVGRHVAVPSWRSGARVLRDFEAGARPAPPVAVSVLGSPA
jgi:hypothetical protein